MIVLSLAIAAAQLVASFSGDTSPAPRPRAQSFSLSDWRGWTAPDDHTVLLRVSGNDIYQIELAHGTSLLQSPSARLVSVVRESERVRDPVDLDLRVSDATGLAVPIRAKSIRRLSRAEIETLPRRDRP